MPGESSKGAKRRGGQPPRRAVRQIHDPELAHRLEHHAPPVGRHRRPPREANGKARFGDAHLPVGHLGNGPLHHGGEGNGDDIARLDVDAHQLASSGQIDRARVRRPRIAWKHPQRLHPFGHVHLDRIEQDALGARLEIPQPERVARTVLVSLEGDRAAGNPAGEGEPATVGRNLQEQWLLHSSPGTAVAPCPPSSRSDSPSARSSRWS